MKYNATKIISMIMVLILLVGSFSGCFSVCDQSDESTKPVESTKLSENKELREAYYNLEVVKHIDEIMSEVIDVSLEDMNMLKELCLQKYAPKYDYIDSESIEIIVKGKYDNMYAVVVDNIEKDDTSEFVGGHEFSYNFTTPLTFIKDGEIYGLAEVYDRGWITDDELYRLYIRSKYLHYSFDLIDCIPEGAYINVTIVRSQNERVYTPEDFSDINCIELKDVTPKKSLEKGRIVRSLRLYFDNASPQKILEYVCILATRPDVHMAIPRMSVNIQWEAEPNDTKYRNNEQWAIDAISLPEAWDITTGSSSVLVGIIDSGIYTDHEDLDGRVDTDLSMNFVDENVSATYDIDGHGSRIAGIIGALSDNNQGMVGVCWNVTLVSLKIGNGVTIDNLDEVADAINYANENDIPILNASFGVYFDNIKLREAIQNYDGLFVCSAGNDGLNNDSAGVNHYPSDYTFSNIIAVGASNEDDEKYSWSHIGNTSVDLFAPGEGILSVEINGLDNSRYSCRDGTSYAAPYVAGVAALLISAHPELAEDIDELKKVIMLSVDQLGALNGYCVTGGRLNAKKAIEYASIHTMTTVTNGTSVTHNVKCTSSSCGLEIVELHYFVCRNVNSDHITKCSGCGYVLIIDKATCDNIEDPDTHIAQCNTCGHTYSEEHFFSNYTNFSLSRGHKVTCGQCGYYYIEQHHWKGVVGGFVCSECGCQSSTPVIGPGIMYDDDEEETE